MSVVIADGRKVIGVEEGAGVGELRAFVAVFEAAAGVGDGEVHVQLVAWCKGRVQLVDGVERREDLSRRCETVDRTERWRLIVSGQ